LSRINSIDNRDAENKEQLDLETLETTKNNAISLEPAVDWKNEHESLYQNLALISKLVSLRSYDDNEWRSVKNTSYYFEAFVNGRLKLENCILINPIQDTVIVVPVHMFDEICSAYHDSISSAHRGFFKTYDRDFIGHVCSQ
jgi:hypothetical protein